MAALGWYFVKSKEDLKSHLPTMEATFKYAWIGVQSSNPKAAKEDENPLRLVEFQRAGANAVQRYKRDVLFKKGKASQEDKKQFVQEIYDIAAEYRVTSGKWLLFPKREQADEWWTLIATAVLEGKLAANIKISPCPPGKKTAVICIYCNFTDKSVCKETLDYLKELGMRVTAPYKADALTHLHLYSSDFKELQISGCWSMHYDLIGRAAKYF